MVIWHKLWIRLFFSLHQNQNIFFSYIGNQNIFISKKTITPLPLFKLNGRSLIDFMMKKGFNNIKDLYSIQILDNMLLIFFLIVFFPKRRKDSVFNKWKNVLILLSIRCKLQWVPWRRKPKVMLLWNDPMVQNHILESNSFAG